MTDLVWDATGNRYFETGVSKGILFDMNRVGVPWNGLISVTLDTSGGELESYYFEGVKYYERILAEEFQATINAISTPPEFEACEGVRNVGNGMRTHFNKRSKFNLCWRTIIGNDVDTAVGYKIHIAYNCMVQPAARAYATLSDSTTPDIRSFVITTTPACGRHSYFSFSSLDGDLSALEARLNAGDLPGCWELLGLTGSGGSGGGAPPVLDPDFDCPSLIVDLEEFIHGQVLDEDQVNIQGGINEVFIYGLVNNGLDIIQLDANGTYTPNDSAATVVGSGDVLADDDDATYISSADGDLGYTIGLPPLVGYVEGSALELHIRMSITGDVNADDPDVIDADAQVFITTDVDGDLPVGGFSDGTDEGVGFALTSVDGTIEDYVVPLNMDPWFDSSLEDVITALEAGTYLNVVGATNNNFATTPEVRVYEAYVLVLNDTDPDKWLRIITPDDYGRIEQHIYDTGTDDLVASVTTSIDFKVFNIPYNGVGAGYTQQPMQWLISGSANNDPGKFQVELNGSGDGSVLKWFNDADTDRGITPLALEVNKWYTIIADWGWSECRGRVLDRETGEVLYDHTVSIDGSPVAFAQHYCGLVGD